MLQPENFRADRITLLNYTENSMTRCASPRCLQTVCDDGAGRSRVIARLKKVDWRKRRNSKVEMREECECRASTATVEPTTPTSPLPPPNYDVFLGGSCGNTVWRRQLVIPFLKKRGISYYDPQRSVWSENMIYEESIAKENSSLFLFVIDPATVNATSFLEIAYFAARKSPKLVVVFLGKTEWKEKAHPTDLPDRNRTCQLLDRILDAHNVPMLHSIQDALCYIEEEIIGSKSWKEVVSVPCQRLAYISLRAKRCARATQERARSAVQRLRGCASKAGVAGLVDAIILIACQILLPTVPIYLLVLPLLMVNMLVIVSIGRFQRYRATRPRCVQDSSYFPNHRAAAIPSPRMPTVMTPLYPQGKKGLTAKSKRFCDDLVVEDGSSAFILPEQFRRPLNGLRLPAKPTENTNCVELVSSSLEETDWVSTRAIPQMDGMNILYSKGLSTPGLIPDIRMNCLKAWQTNYKYFLYHIPSAKTFLSGMVEIAYMLGHSTWQVTVCVPKEAETLEVCSTVQEDENERASRRRRNDCYQIAYCYLKDMAKRRQCRVFHDVDEAVRHVSKVVQQDGL